MIHFINWWGTWQGLGFYHWNMKHNGAISRLIDWSILLGFWEIRHVRRTWLPKEPTHD
jgi:hypothetical protein